MMINTSKLIMVGGFLGAGKTTLLYEATRLLIGQEKKVGLLTNDQASELVDTALLLHTDAQVAELSGSCFCCNFNGFITSLKQVKLSANADILIAEPVGSCTDLSATIMQPLKEHFNRELVVSPLTVLADPHRLRDILDGGLAGLHPDAAYIFNKQLEESDIILISKSDLVSTADLDVLIRDAQERFSNPNVMSISSKTGAGVGEWLHKVLESPKAGQKIIEVDYDKYANGEAVLGWLNATVELQGKQTDWDVFAGHFLSGLSQKIDAQKISVGHIKIMLETDGAYILGNITGKGQTLSLRGSAGTSNQARIIVNARAGMEPQQLECLVKDQLASISGQEICFTIKALKSLSPGYPAPTYRYNKIV